MLYAQEMCGRRVALNSSTAGRCINEACEARESALLLQFCVERIVGAHGMINYVDARTAWMDDIVKQAQWQGITQVGSPWPVMGF